MAKVQGEGADFDEMKMPDEEATPEESFPAESLEGMSFQELDFDALESLDVPQAVDEAAAQPLAEPMEPEGEPATPESEPIEAEKTEEEKDLEKGPKEKAAKGPSKLPVYLEWVGVAGIPVLLIVLALLQALDFSTASYVIAIGFVGYGIWKGRATNTVYTVILACTLVAILTAIYCLWMEIDRYHFDIKARESKQRISMVQPALQSAQHV